MTTKITSLDSSIHSTVEWLRDIQEELGWDDEDRTYAATKAALHGIRDRLPVSEAVQFSAHLPMVLKGVYFQSYQPEETPKKIRNRDEFLNYIKDNFDQGPLDPETILMALLKVYKQKTKSTGELKDIEAILPEDLQGLFTKVIKE